MQDEASTKPDNHGNTFSVQAVSLVSNVVNDALCIAAATSHGVLCVWHLDPSTAAESSLSNRSHFTGSTSPHNGTPSGETVGLPSLTVTYPSAVVTLRYVIDVAKRDRFNKLNAVSLSADGSTLCAGGESMAVYCYKLLHCPFASQTVSAETNSIVFFAYAYLSVRYCKTRNLIVSIF